MCYLDAGNLRMDRHSVSNDSKKEMGSVTSNTEDFYSDIFIVFLPIPY